MNSLRASLARQLPLLAPLLLLSSLSASAPNHAAQRCNYLASDLEVIQLPQLRVYEESIARIQDDILFSACTSGGATARVTVNCSSEAVSFELGQKHGETPNALLPPGVVSELCGLYPA